MPNDHNEYHGIKQVAARCIISGVLPLVVILAGTVSGRCADVIILGDSQLKPVAAVISGIRTTIKSSSKIISPAEAKDNLSRIVAAEDAKVVIALGKDAVDKAIRLPLSIPVICGLVIIPPNDRPNMTCGYMATPVSEYLALMRRYFPALKKIAVVSTPEIQRLLGGGTQGQIVAYQAGNSFDLVSRVKQLSGIEALLLLPDVPLLTSTALDEIYLFSFRNKIPVLGVSEKHVKQGALFALVFDANNLGRQIGEKASEALSNADLSQTPSFPSRKFDIFINTETAEKMGIVVPDELLRRARKVYP